MNYAQLIAKLDNNPNTEILQQALNLRQELLEKIGPELRQVEKLEEALKTYAKARASDGKQVFGYGNTMHVNISNNRVINDTAAAIDYLDSQNLPIDQFVSISVEKAGHLLPAELISLKPVVRVSFK